MCVKLRYPYVVLLNGREGVRRVKRSRRAKPLGGSGEVSSPKVKDKDQSPVSWENHHLRQPAHELVNFSSGG
jgi:hypothetical protein